MFERRPIGPNDIVSIRDRHLVVGDGNERFLMEGIAFPIPIPRPKPGDAFDLEGWMAILDQLANDTEINTIRLYDLDCVSTDDKFIDKFFNRAAKLGIYIVVPLTAVTGGGVLDRSLPAPDCYNSTLYEYGVSCVNLFSKYPNVVAAMVGNEVMNSLITWDAAPCVHAYARDLQYYMEDASAEVGSGVRKIPLSYAAQHDGIGAQVLPDEAMEITLNCLTCRLGNDTAHADSNNSVIDKGIDIFGINIESWCSSLQTYKFEEDGFTVGSYYHMFQQFVNTSSTPLVFTEMGCSKELFNKDNGLPPQMARDWKQIPVVLDDMRELFSGFIAYAYDGNPVFRMMDKQGSPWNGHDVLTPSLDYNNFVQELHDYHQTQNNADTTVTQKTINVVQPPLCSDVWTVLNQRLDLVLYPMNKMPSFFFESKTHKKHKTQLIIGGGIIAIIIASAVATMIVKFLKRQKQNYKPALSSAIQNGAAVNGHNGEKFEYGAIKMGNGHSAVAEANYQAISNLEN